MVEQHADHDTDHQPQKAEPMLKTAMSATVTRKVTSAPVTWGPLKAVWKAPCSGLSMARPPSTATYASGMVVMTRTMPGAKSPNPIASTPHQIAAA